MLKWIQDGWGVFVKFLEDLAPGTSGQVVGGLIVAGFLGLLAFLGRMVVRRIRRAVAPPPADPPFVVTDEDILPTPTADQLRILSSMAADGGRAHRADRMGNAQPFIQAGTDALMDPADSSVAERFLAAFGDMERHGWVELVSREYGENYGLTSEGRDMVRLYCPTPDQRRILKGIYELGNLGFVTGSFGAPEYVLAGRDSLYDTSDPTVAIRYLAALGELERRGWVRYDGPAGRNDKRYKLTSPEGLNLCLAIFPPPPIRKPEPEPPPARTRLDILKEDVAEEIAAETGMPTPDERDLLCAMRASPNHNAVILRAAGGSPRYVKAGDRQFVGIRPDTSMAERFIIVLESGLVGKGWARFDRQVNNGEVYVLTGEGLRLAQSVCSATEPAKPAPPDGVNAIDPSKPTNPKGAGSTVASPSGPKSFTSKSDIASFP